MGPPLSVFAPIQSPSELATTVTLDCLLDEAATALGAVRIERAKQHGLRAKPADAEKIELRKQAAKVLSQRFRERLGQPYSSHVATIVGLLSGLKTDSDYVKKVERQARRGTARG
jgi:hypothetical protein